MVPEPLSPPDPFPIPASDAELLAQCRVETFTAGGPGGQHQNRTESAVRLVHEPTGVRVTVRDERSQYRNRQLALKRLRERLERRNRRRTPRVGTKVPRGEKERRLREKKRRADVKRTRRPPEPEGD